MYVVCMNEFSLQLAMREFIHFPVSYSPSVAIKYFKSPSWYSEDPRFKPDDRLSRKCSSIPLLVIQLKKKVMDSLK